MLLKQEGIIFYSTLHIGFLILGQKLRDEMTLHSIHLQSEGKQWRTYWEEKYRKGSIDSKHIKKFKRVDGKDCYMLEEPTDSLIETLNATDRYCFPNLYKILEIACISHLTSTEAERAASGIRKLKTSYRSTMTDARERNLNLIQLQGMVEIDTIKVANIFIKSRKRRLMHDLPPSKFSKS